MFAGRWRGQPDRPGDMMSGGVPTGVEADLMELDYEADQNPEW